MEHNWVIVADAAHARIFEVTNAQGQLHQIGTLSHPESQMYASQLRTGGKGDVIDSAGFGHHQPDPQVSQSEKHAARFASELAQHLYHKRTEAAYDRLILVAEPKFLGLLRSHLDAATAKKVAASIDKNWVQHDPRQIEKSLHDQL